MLTGLDAQSVVQRLGGLPLALARAGSYLGETNISSSAYLRHLDRASGDLKESQDRDLVPAYHTTFWATWMVSYKRVEAQNESAAHLLKLWAFLDRQDLWYQLIATTLDLKLGMEVPGWLSRITEDEQNFHDAMGVLRRHSLIDSNMEAGSYSMHPVLHEWCLRLSNNEQRGELWLLAVSILGSKYMSKADPPSQRLQARFLPHVFQTYYWLANHPRRGSNIVIRSEYLNSLSIPETLYPMVFNQASNFTVHSNYCLGIIYSTNGNLIKANEMIRKAMDLAETRGDFNMMALLLARIADIGDAYRNQGNLVKAEEMYQAVKARFKKDYGDSVRALIIVQSLRLGRIYKDVGNLIKTEELYWEARRLGAASIDPDLKLLSAKIILDLGLSYQAQGNFNKAEKLYQRIKQESEAEFGSDHESTRKVQDLLDELYRSKLLQEYMDELQHDRSRLLLDISRLQLAVSSEPSTEESELSTEENALGGAENEQSRVENRQSGVEYEQRRVENELSQNRERRKVMSAKNTKSQNQERRERRRSRSAANEESRNREQRKTRDVKNARNQSQERMRPRSAKDVGGQNQERRRRRGVDSDRERYQERRKTRHVKNSRSRSYERRRILPQKMNLEDDREGGSSSSRIRSFLKTLFQ